MVFEFDPEKSAANKLKHGIDFDEAKALWRDPRRVQIDSVQQHHGEQRRLLIARAYDRVWAAVVTMRGETIRIISVRRARDYEETGYEQA